MAKQTNALDLARSAFDSIKSKARSFGFLPPHSPVPKERKPDVSVMFNRNPTPTTAPTTGFGSSPRPTATPTPAPARAPVGASRSPSPTPLPSRYKREDITKAIEQGFQEWAGAKVPAQQYAANFAEAPFRYPETFGNYPFLLPAMAIAETSAGQHTAAPENYINWGFRQQLARGPQHNPGFPAILEEAMSGIGERSSAYAPFRKSLDIADLANVYAPPSENQTDKYITDIQELMRIFEQQLE